MNKKWTYEICKEEALKYNSRGDFQKYSGSAYDASRRNKWLDDICSHMIEIRKYKGYWTKENSHKEALKYNTKTDFLKNNKGVYCIASKNKWLDEICSHMKELRKPNNYWTKEKSHAEALNYSSRHEFQKKSQICYSISAKNKWLDDICSHMKELRKPKGYTLTKERCHEDALNCQTRYEFQKKFNSTYNYARKNNWLDDICYHMKIIGNLYKRCIYSFEFPDNCAYIGLTGNIEKRKIQHFNNKNSSVYKYIQKTGLQPELKQLTEYIDKNLAIIKENEFVQQYKTYEWKILNKKKTGGLGAVKLFWTKVRCYEEALKYDNKTSFEKNSYSAYQSARKHGWFNEICSHMKEFKKPNGYWIKERCHNEAKKYINRKKFQKLSGGAYGAAYKNKWLDEICSHMNKNNK